LHRSFRFLAAAVAALALAGCSGSGGDEETSTVSPPARQYNVVILLADALRQDALGCYGGTAGTPNIDMLARRGVVFDNAHSTSPWTSPSSVAIFTGNYATSYEYAREGLTKPHPGQSHDEQVDIPQIYVPDSEFTLAEAVQQAGYSTGFQSENINAVIHNANQGMIEISQDPPAQAAGDSINRLCQGGIARSFDNAGYQHAFIYLKYLLGLAPQERFFTMHWMLDPHSPYDPPKLFANRIFVDESQLEVPRDWYSKKRYHQEELSSAEREFVRNLYLAEVESIDERVGFVLAMLKHLNRLDDTYIVFISDHGEAFGEHGLYEHGGHGRGCHFYEELMRVPFIIAGPGLPAGKRVSDPVTLLDLMPTLKDLLGVDYESTMQGRSLVPLIAGRAHGDSLYFDDVQEHEQIDAFVAGGFKLIDLEGGGRELYALDADPGETDNLAGTMSERVRELQASIDRHREENLDRQRRNLAALGDEIPEMSETEREKVLEKLRALGYVQ
jgi:choline-sulfatase